MPGYIYYTVPPVIMPQYLYCKTLKGCCSVSNDHTAYKHGQIVSFSEQESMAGIAGAIFNSSIGFYKRSLCRSYSLHVPVGDGPMRSDLEEVRQENSLQDRVTFLGYLCHDKMRDVSSPGL